MIMVSECDHNIVTLWTRTWIVVVCHEHLAVFVVAVVLPTTVVGAVPGSSAEGPGLLLSATNTLLFLLLLLYFQQLLSVLFQAPQLLLSSFQTGPFSSCFINKLLRGRSGAWNSTDNSCCT